MGAPIGVIIGVMLGALGIAGCAPTNSVRGGAPVMLSFGPVDSKAPYDPFGGPAYLPLVTAVGAAAAITPRSSFLAIFDRILDPTTLEDTAGGAEAGIAAVTSDVPGSMTIAATKVYSPDGDPTYHVLLPAGPSLTVATACGMPSGANGTVQLDMTKFRSHDQTTPAVLADGVVAALAFGTDPFSVTTDVPAPDPTMPADPGLVVNLNFNTITPPGLPDACQLVPPLPSIASHIQVSGTLGGVPLAPLVPVVTQDSTDASHWLVSPPGTGPDGTGGSWPAGATITITVDTGATDGFNRPLAAAVTASFTVKS